VSLPDSELDKPRGVLVRKPRTSIYTVLLGLALAAMSLGCLALLMEVWQYGPPWAAPWSPPH
jgi:hypothetical protein